MSMERRFEQICAQVASRLVERPSRTAAALAAALVLGTVSFIALRQWCPAHEAAEPVGQISCLADDVSVQAGRLAVVEASPLVADRWASRVGSQQKLLQPVQGAIVLEPARGADTG